MTKVITNHVPRDIVQPWELTIKEREQFDYLDWEALEAGNDSREFFRYRGETYDLSDFPESIPPGTPGRWDRFRSDSFYSGIVVRFLFDGEEPTDQIIVGLLLA